jgi:hypothetical protein
VVVVVVVVEVVIVVVVAQVEPCVVHLVVVAYL